LEKVRKGEMFKGAKNEKYADEYLAILSCEYNLPPPRSKLAVK